jgi:hypothetical protein
MRPDRHAAHQADEKAALVGQADDPQGFIERVRKGAGLGSDRGFRRHRKTSTREPADQCGQRVRRAV